MGVATKPRLVPLPDGQVLDLDVVDTYPADVRRQVYAHLEELEGSYEENPLRRFYPHPRDLEGRAPQQEFLAATSPVVAVFAGNQFGKTTVGLVKDLIDCLDRSAVPKHLQDFKKWEPPFFCRIIVPSFGLLEESIFPAIREWCPAGQLLGDSFEKAYTEGPPRKLRFKNGSYLGFMTYEQTSEGEKKKFGSVRLHRVHYDEEPPKKIRQESQHRLVKLAGDELFTMTPQDGLGWTYRDIWKQRHQPHITAVRGDTEQNKSLDRETLERLWASMSDEELAYRKRGEFIHVGGFAFPLLPDRVVDFPNDAEHIERLKGQDIVVGIDPGIRFAGISFNAFDNDNAAVTFDELLLREATAPDYVEAIQQILAKWGLRVEDVIFVIDPSARNRGLAGGESIETELARYGILTVPGMNDRQAGVMQLRRRLAHGSWHVSNDCRHLLDETDEYVLVERPDGSWEPVKGNDHVTDGTRYALMFRPWLADPEPMKRRGYQPGYEPAYAPDDVQDYAPMGPMS